MPELPPQLRWRLFVCVLRKLGYTARKTKQGSVKIVCEPGTYSDIVSLRETHPGQNLRPPMLRAHLRALLLSPDEFLQLLKDC